MENILGTNQRQMIQTDNIIYIYIDFRYIDTDIDIDDIDTQIYRYKI